MSFQLSTMPAAEEVSAWETYEAAGTKQARNLHHRRRSVQVDDGLRRLSARDPSAGGRQSVVSMIACRFSV